MDINTLINTVDTNALLARPLSDWRMILINEVQVYVFGENYLAKRFDQIHYKFCEKNEAKEILIDNLYALLRYKYFTKTSESTDERIKDIVASFTANLKTTLKKVSFDVNSDANIVKMLPDYCIAFRNGVYNFKDNDWLFKYYIINLNNLSNTIYNYDPSYIILWYLDYNFDPLPINIFDTSFEDFVQIMKTLTQDTKNYCFELLYNMSHTTSHTFDINKMKHLCEILGYSTLQSFSQYFVMLIGSGQNGKNSLFDGCFTNRVIPRPAANDLDSIENDRFITGALENKSHNIFLETAAKVYTESKMLKALTGSMYQTIESKGIQKYSGVINCKYIFAGNDQDKIKFTDTTIGFKRRINIFEISYRWDNKKKFLSYGDYYDTTFSDSLSELKSDAMNTTAYVYFSMYGLLFGTEKFTTNFKFTYNDWNMRYSDTDVELKDKISNITINDIVEYAKKTASSYQIVKTSLYDTNKHRLYLSNTLSQYGINTFDDLLEMFEDASSYTPYFSDNDIYINIRLLQLLSGSLSSTTTFTQTFRKVYNIDNFNVRIGNIPYVKCSIVSGKLKIYNN